MTLRFRACGPGCFVSPVDWTRGLATVTLRASAEGWTGGTTALTVAWPARAAPEMLLRAVRTMRRVKTFTLHEQVTSDTSQVLGQPTRLGLSGRKFLASEPYGSGLAPTVVVLGQSGRETTIALAYPGEGTYVRPPSMPTTRSCAKPCQHPITWSPEPSSTPRPTTDTTISTDQPAHKACAPTTTRNQVLRRDVR